MARLPALIEVLGRHHPRGAMGVENYARILRKAKKIAPSKRGVGAANVTVSDASNLLFGLAEMNNALFAPVAVDMQRGALMVGQWEGQPDPLDTLADYDMDLNFATLGELLDSILLQLSKNPMPRKLSKPGFIRSIELRMQNPTVLGARVFVSFQIDERKTVVIEYFCEHPDFHLRVDRGATDPLGDFLDQMSEADQHDQPSTGISFEVNVSATVLWAVARCVIPKDGNGGTDSS